MTTLAAFLLAITGSIASRALLSLGFGLFSYAALTGLTDSVLNLAQAQFGSIQSTVLTLINLGGIGQFMGIVASAMITKAALCAIKRLRPV